MENTTSVAKILQKMQQVYYIVPHLLKNPF